MNDGVKCGLFLLGGILLGAAGVAAVSKGKLNLRPLMTDILSRGLDARDAVLAKVETAKENMEDLMAEARHTAETRKEAKDSQC